MGEVPQEYKLSQYNQDHSIRSLHKNPSFGLSHLGITHEFWESTHTEEDLTVFQKEVNGPAAAQVLSSELSIGEVDELLSQSSDSVSHHSPVPYDSKFRPRID